MKRFIAVLSSLLVLPAFAEIAPAYYYEELMAQYAEEMPDADFITEEIEVSEPQQVEEPVVPVTPNVTSPRNATGRTTSSRVMTSSSTSNSSRNLSSRNASNTTTARTVSSRPTSTSSSTVSRSNATRSGTTTTTSRSAAATTTANRQTPAIRSTAANSSQPGVTARNTSNSETSNTARASIVQTDTVNTPLYVSSSSRVGVSNTASVSTRVPTVRVGSSTSTTSSTESVSSAVSIDELAQLTDYCKAQYVACMDNFCNVLDDNQGRCSCSANLSNYSETEEALKQATESLQDVAQQIQYIGLSADQVESLFTQTEAELEMQKTSDNTQLKNSLDKIKAMIVDVKPGTASTSSSSSGLSFDLSGLLDFSIDSTGFDLSSFLGMSNNTDSISNQRGEQLYKTAAARCKAAVLNSCSAQGVDVSVITNSYDLEIDKACIAYERSLTESNDQMTATVRNAKSVLQRARLLVAQQKNVYNLRECITELDSCMQEDFVCGDDYENCLDPTGKYIVNGEIVIGSTPGAQGDSKAPIYETWKYDTNKSAWGTDEATGSLSDYISTTVSDTAAKNPSTNMSEFLQNKIGYNEDGKNYGMCISVLNQCQDYSYDGTGQNAKYNPTNNVIKEFLNRTLVQIKSSQDTILADYAENCISDVSACLAQSNYDVDNNTEGSDGKPVLSAGNKLAIKACNSIITTCMSVNGITNDIDTGDPLTAEEWIAEIIQ